MFDLSQAWATIQRLANSFVAMVPRFILAALLTWAFTFVGRLARRLVERGTAKRREHRTLQLAPFSVGDQIIFKEFEGTVEDIQTRATLLKTYDGRRVLIPNSDLYMNAVTVNTAFPIRRIEYDLGIGMSDDVEQAKRGMVEVMRGVDGVLRDPAPDVLVVGIGDSTLNLRARWWATSQVPAALLAQDRVLSGIKARLQRDGIRVTGLAENSELTTVAVRATETEGTSGDAHTEEAPANT